MTGPRSSHYLLSRALGAAASTVTFRECLILEAWSEA